jgi:hypothetical protein
MRKYLFASLLIFGVLLCSIPALSYAQEYKAELQGMLEATAGEDGGGLGEATDPRVIVAIIIRTSLGLIGTLFLVYTVYSGFIIMTSAGDKDKYDNGIKTLRRSALGLLLILMSYAITTFVVGMIIEDGIGIGDKYTDIDNEVYDTIKREQNPYATQDPLNERTYYFD